MKELAKAAGNEYGSLVDDGIFGGDVTQWIDTGSYVLNALLSGSIYGGLPANKIFPEPCYKICFYHVTFPISCTLSQRPNFLASFASNHTSCAGIS